MSHDKGPTGAPLELDLSIRGDRWPWEFANPSAEARGAFSGTLDVHDKEGHLSLAGDARILDLQATGKALTGDTIKLDAVSAVWKVDRAGGIWTADRLDVTSAGGDDQGQRVPSRPPTATRRTSRAISTSPPWPGKSPGPSACATTFASRRARSSSPRTSRAMPRAAGSRSRRPRSSPTSPPAELGRP